MQLQEPLRSVGDLHVKLLRHGRSYYHKQVVEGILLYGAIINTMLGGFNLIPAFPLDGGRILRAGLVAWKKDYDTATRTAARVGIAISYGFMAAGF